MSNSLSNALTTSAYNILRPEDFDPPLKRKEATIPGYWTVEEIAKELGVTTRKIQYDIKGNPQLKKSSPKLRAYRIKLAFLVPDPDALEYIWNYREEKKKS